MWRHLVRSLFEMTLSDAKIAIPPVQELPPRVEDFAFRVHQLS